MSRKYAQNGLEGFFKCIPFFIPDRNARSRMKCRFGNIEISLLNETRNEIDVHYGRNKDFMQNGTFHSNT